MFMSFKPHALCLALSLLAATPCVLAEDFSNGVSHTSGSNATLWFDSNVNTSWVDAHYRINGGGQLNVRMHYNPASGRYETTIPAGIGSVVTSWFTYNNGQPAYDSQPTTITLGSPTPPGSAINFPAQGTTFNLVNGTKGAYADNAVYWTMVGMDPSKQDAYVHVDCAGNLVPMQAGDNQASGTGYANYSIPLSQCKRVTVRQIKSARLYLSVGSPLFLRANGNPVNGYAGPNIDNPSDPNIPVIFDFVEMHLDNHAFFGNTTRVDMFGFPVRMRLQSKSGFDQTVGETESRAALFNAFKAQTSAPFQQLARSPYRIVAPTHGGFQAGGPYSQHLDGYINAIWSQYSWQTLTIDTALGTFTGRVVGNQFRFSDAQGTYYVNGKPTTAQTLACNGVFADATHAAPGVATAKQLQIQAQLCAALNRTVAHDAKLWSRADSFYQQQQTNEYSRFWHAHSINGLSYGFSYDDVREFSSSLTAANPSIATITIGW